MSSIDFGLGWDPSSTIKTGLLQDKQDQSLVVESNKPVLTKAKLRKITIKELFLSVRNQDVKGVKDILKSNPQLLSDGKVANLNVLSLDNFQAQIMDALLDAGMPLPNYLSHNSFIKKKSLDMLKFFVDKEKKESWVQSPFTPDNLYRIHKMWYMFPDESSDIVLKSTLDQMWFSTYDRILDGAIKDDVFSQDAIDLLDEKFSELKKIKLYYLGSLFKIISSSSINNQWRKKYLSSVDIKIWDYVIKNDFTNPSKFYSNNKNKEHFDIRSMALLVDMFKDNEKIKSLWDKQQKQQLSQSIKRDRWYDKYFPSDKDFDNTPFWSIISNLEFSDDYSKPPLLGIGNKSFGYLYRHVCEILYHEFSKKNKNSLSLKTFNDVVRENGIKKIQEIEFRFLVDQNDPQGQVIDDNPGAYIPPSFVHTLVQSGNLIVESIINNAEGKIAIEKCFQDPYTVSAFMKHTSTNTLSKVCKALPSFLDYTDKFGNSPAHMFVITRALGVNNAMVNDLFKISKDWFILENKEGFNLLNLLSNSISPDFLSRIEKKLIKDAMKDDSDVGKKIRSRTKYSAPKRKI